MPPSEKRLVRMQLDPRLGLPIYVQIVRHIHRRARTGGLAAGVQLPTVRDLARQLGVNFNTVARAYRLLARSGTLSTQPGRGTFVLMASTGRKPGTAALHELAAEYVAGARQMDFSDAQISGALSRVLRRPAASPRPGDSHE